MKKLGKLEINSRKLLKKEELVTLKGGYEGCDYWCCTYDGIPPIYGGHGSLLTCGVGCDDNSAMGAEATCNATYNVYGIYCLCV